MSTLNIQVDAQLAPFTTQMRRFDKGLEQFYYALLLTSERRYQNKSRVWRSWLEMGFHIQTRSHPPMVEPADRLAITIRPDGKTTNIAFRGGNPGALGRLQRFIEALEAKRSALRGPSSPARLQQLLAAEAVTAQLLAPVGDALKRAEFRPDEAQLVRDALERGLEAFADDEIKSVKVTLST